MLTAVTSQVSPSTSILARTAAPSWVASKVHGTLGGSSVGSPISTLTWPSARTSGWMRPARVPTLYALGSAPSILATKLARHLMPLPHISGSVPSELYMRME